jgi:hypothetical protein
LSAPSTEGVASDPPPQKTIEENDEGADISDALSSRTESIVKAKAHPQSLSKSIDESEPQEEPTLPEIDPDDMDVESLQKRLKLVEQRFTGMLLCVCGSKMNS